jgi:hypothetical protein
MKTADAKEGIRAFFEKLAPVRKASRPKIPHKVE